MSSNETSTQRWSKIITWLWNSQKIFGVEYSDIVKRGQITKNGVPKFLELAFFYIEKNGLETEGIFRLSATKTELDEVRTELDSGKDVDFSSLNIHLVSALIKLYLRELPTPITSFELFDEFIKSNEINQIESRIAHLNQTIKKLPEPNQMFLKRLIKLFTRVAIKQDINKMTPTNCAIVLAPTLFKRKDRSPSEMVRDVASAIVTIVFLIQYFSKIFFDIDYVLSDFVKIESLDKNGLFKQALESKDLCLDPTQDLLDDFVLVEDIPKAEVEKQIECPSVAQNIDSDTDRPTWNLITMSTFEIQMPHPPICTIYTHSARSTKSSTQNLATIHDLLSKVKELKASDTKEVDISEDFELQSYIKSRIKGAIHYPIVFIRDNPVGNVESLQSHIKNGDLIKMINFQPFVGVKQDVQSLFRSGSSPDVSLSKLKGPDEIDTIDFDVIHSSYFTRQKRILKFGKTEMFRIHPKTGETRAIRKYDDVSKITFVDEGNIIIRYSSGVPDYIRCTSSCLQMMVQIILANSSKEIVVE